MTTAAHPSIDDLVLQVARRRTFAIISHPDAGKTTLTEKILLYAGAIELAGAVRGRKTRRHAVSDWMAMEQERGISLTSTALEFDLADCRMSLLDTPGHRDFSEDTYRALLAADSVVMVVDAAKGIEAQTRKLFEVCHRHRLPMLTFVNKLDQPGREPLELLDEIEQVLKIHAVPMNWPVGRADRFRGVYDLRERVVQLYERQDQGQRRAPMQVTDHRDPRLAELAGEGDYREFLESIEIVSGAGTVFQQSAYLAGQQTPVFFGSALNNFGLEPFLEGLTSLAPAPGARAVEGGMVDPVSSDFSGFVFKLQANMDPRHRDRVAFVRVCSGRLIKDMTVTNSRLGGTVRVARPYRLFGRDRHTVDIAYAGDIVGLVNPGRFAIGDSLYSGTPVQFKPIPRFAAEHFGRLRIDGVGHKQFDRGVRELEEEGLMQVLYVPSGGRDPIIGVVGPLQLDVVQARLESEYGVTCRVEPMAYTHLRSIEPETIAPAALNGLARDVLPVVNRQGQHRLLFSSAWAVEHAERQNPTVRFLSEL